MLQIFGCNSSYSKNGGMSSSTYYSKMCSIKDELSNIGKIIEDDEMINYIVNALTMITILLYLLFLAVLDLYL